jgi:hypothetical protein
VNARSADCWPDSRPAMHATTLAASLVVLLVLALGFVTKVTCRAVLRSTSSSVEALSARSQDDTPANSRPHSTSRAHGFNVRPTNTKCLCGRMSHTLSAPRTVHPVCHHPLLHLLSPNQSPDPALYGRHRSVRPVAGGSTPRSAHTSVHCHPC